MSYLSNGARLGLSQPTPPLTRRWAARDGSSDKKYFVGPQGRLMLKPTKAVDYVPTRNPNQPLKSLAARLEDQKKYEVLDMRSRDIAADLIRQVVIIFFMDPSSPWRTDPEKMRKSVIRQKQENVDVDEVLPIPLPDNLPGVEWVPSRIAFACYNRGSPYGTAIVIDSMKDYGTNLHIIATFHVEHELLRSMFIGLRGQTMKQLVVCCNEQLSIQYQRPVKVQLYVEPSHDWGKMVGGIWRLLPY